MTWTPKSAEQAWRIFEVRRQRDILDAEARRKFAPHLAAFRAALAKKEPKGLPP